MYERFTERALRVMTLAKGEARQSGNSEVYTDNLLVGLYDEGSGVAAHVLRALGVLPIRQKKAAKGYTGDPIPGEVVKAALQSATSFADDRGEGWVSTEHLLVGLIRTRGLDYWFRGEGRRVTGREVEAEVMRVLGNGKAEPVDDGQGCHFGECDDTCGLVESKCASALSDYLMCQVSELKDEVKAEKELNRKLWLAVSKLQQSVGIANGWLNNGSLPEKEFRQQFRDGRDQANALLDGIVSLTEAKDAP